ncbi:hypothetical protein BDB00DRAFT_839139 [Zychaea mexicana]|uniref:uncharacterized protein n=1 Tax=Zychaea mexicana TaxID=64656 RepID=UPI0022FE277E|nr:uncharacterized protein BDB00DRAFT_839139 [Zychaea mexicana]KAI9490139.1 hypothetical protein BDB00DRAFT_839139 [Zychaea mexicana]
MHYRILPIAITVLTLLIASTSAKTTFCYAENDCGPYFKCVEGPFSNIKYCCAKSGVDPGMNPCCNSDAEMTHNATGHFCG